jgi:hypothetical protein
MVLVLLIFLCNVLSRKNMCPLARWGATWAPTTAPIPTDGMDMTVHSGQEHGNHALI